MLFPAGDRFESFFPNDGDRIDNKKGHESWASIILETLTVLRAESKEGKSATAKIECADRPGRRCNWFEY